MEQKSLLIAYKELFPIVVDAALWGSEWVSQQVKFLCDNESVVSVLKSGSSQDQHLIGLLRHLSLLAIRHSFVFTVSSVHGKGQSCGWFSLMLSISAFLSSGTSSRSDLTCVIPLSLLTFATGLVTLTGMAPSLLPMRRCALLHS